MKLLVLALAFATGCSSWKQTDFEKSIERPVETKGPEVTAEEKKLLEKFEVKETPALVEEKPVAKEAPKTAPVKKVPAPAIAKPPKTTALNLQKPLTPAPKKEVVAPAPMETGLPKKYPPEFVKINENAKKVWDQYKPNIQVGVKTFLDIHFLGMTVGKIMFVNQGKKIINGKEAWHFHARFKSAPFYSNIYELDNTVDTYVSTDQFLSAKYTLIQRESKQSVDDIQLFDREKLKTFWLYHQKKSDGTVRKKDEKKFMPYYSTDPFTCLFLFQGLPLNPGDKYDIPLMNKGKTLLLNAEVEARETIDTEVGKKKAIRLHAITQYTGDHLKSGDMTFWFSDDAERRLLRASAKIKIGSVTADIVKE